jgi:PIN domain nuclease of toxin-antitoxin system
LNIIIDTHIFLWLIYEPKKISKEYMEILEDMTNNIFLSSISVAEIMIKKSIGTLEVDFDVIEMVDKMSLEFLDFDAKSAIVLATLPFYHKDPFDRMLISQAISNKYKILSVDSKFKKYECELL